MTKEAISKRTGADMKEVEWGLKELQKPDPDSLTPDEDGRRIIPLDGHGYGWKIINFEEYRDMKSAAEMRSKAKERARRYRERKAAEKTLEIAKPHDGLTQLNKVQLKAEQNGDTEDAQRCEEIDAGLRPGSLSKPKPNDSEDKDMPF